ncbi:hypothetical protein ANN_05608 [Periplaneta americana]|uniref:Uncharacterized protein n=1 Tax=Periplaneta americana TaxID=6978 RepID=A0ABQ8TDE2_PERAM|nr:hypothetical protein ANN_05608 [Periplaneta americana]
MLKQEEEEKEDDDDDDEDDGGGGGNEMVVVVTVMVVEVSDGDSDGDGGGGVGEFKCSSKSPSISELWSVHTVFIFSSDEFTMQEALSVKKGEVMLNSHGPHLCDYFAAFVWLCCWRNRPHTDHFFVVARSPYRPQITTPQAKYHNVLFRRRQLSKHLSFPTIQCRQQVVGISHCVFRLTTDSDNSVDDTDHSLQQTSTLTSVSGPCELLTSVSILIPDRLQVNYHFVVVVWLCCGLCDNAGEMSPGSSSESYPTFAHIGLRENPGKNLNQVTCPDRETNPGHLVSRPDAQAVTPQVWTALCLTQVCRGWRSSIFALQKEAVVFVPLCYINILSSTPTPSGYKHRSCD